LRTACERCSSTPATLISSRKNLGLILTHKTFTRQLLLCRSCATSRLTMDLIFTSLLGWWSILSPIVNAACITDDIASLSRARKLALSAPAASSGRGAA
jgi:hypothetical protein